VINIDSVYNILVSLLHQQRKTLPEHLAFCYQEKLELNVLDNNSNHSYILKKKRE
jgi:hypothetical protein